VYAGSIPALASKRNEKSPLSRGFFISGLDFCVNATVAETVMEKPVKTPKEALKLIAATWHRAGPFLASIEVWLMVLVAAAMVGGVFLAAMGDARSLLAIGFSVGYLVLRPVLHAKGILSWPFL